MFTVEAVNIGKVCGMFITTPFYINHYGFMRCRRFQWVQL